MKKINDIRESEGICYDCNIELYHTGKFDLYYELCICEKCGRHYKCHIRNKTIKNKTININKVIKEIESYKMKDCECFTCTRLDKVIQIIKDNIKEYDIITDKSKNDLSEYEY